MNLHMRARLLILSSFLVLTTIICCNKNSDNGGTPVVPPPTAADTSFTNPLLSTGPDPWVIKKDTMYYYTHTLGNRIGIFATSKMSALKFANPVTVWTPPATGAYSRNI